MRRIVWGTLLLVVLFSSAAQAARATQTTQPTTRSIAIEDALTWLGAEPADAAAAAADARADGSGDTFRFAVPGSEPATLDVAYGDIVAHLGTAATIGGFGPDRVANVPCGQTLEDEALVLCPSPVELGGPWWVFVMELGGPVPLEDDGLHHSLAIPVLTSGGTPWEPQGDFLWDTFQGTDLWFAVERQPGADWGLQATQSSDFAPVDTGAFALLRGATLVVAVPADALGYPHPADGTDTSAAPGGQPGTEQVVLGAPIPGTPRYGAHQHTHDGTFGQNSSDASVVDSAPDTNTDDRRGPDQLAVARPELVTVGTTPPPTSEATTSPTPSPATDPGDEEPITDDPTDSPTEATTDGRFDDAGEILIALIVGLGAVAGTATVVRRRRPAPCSCRCRVTIEAPNFIETCCSGGELTLNSYPLEQSVEAEDYDPMEDTGLQLDPSRLHLDLDLPSEGWDFHDVVVHAQLEGICNGGEVLVDDATYDWSATLAGDTIVLRVEVTAPVRCPDGGEHADVRCSAEKEIQLREGTCRIGVVIIRNDWDEISHVDVVVECGSYREVFGYFPAGARTFSATIAGGPGDVQRGRNSVAKPHKSGQPVTVEVTDTLGEDFNIYHGSEPLRVYWIVPDDCQACTAVRRYWEDLDANPGTYYLLNNNCALQAVASLKAAGLWQHDQGPTVRPGQVETMLDLQQTLGTDGFTVMTEVDIR